MREQFYKERLEYEIESQEQYHFEWIAREKLRLLENEKHKQERLTVRKLALAERPNPFQKEIEISERLIAYCELIQTRLGLGAITDEHIREEQKQIMNQLAVEEVQNKLKLGKIEIAKTKKEREQEATQQYGERQKKGKKPKQRKF